MLATALSRDGLREDFERAAEQARRDSLTGLANRLAWDEAVGNVAGDGRPVSVIQLDCCSLKQTNDTSATTPETAASHNRADRDLLGPGAGPRRPHRRGRVRHPPRRRRRGGRRLGRRAGRAGRGRRAADRDDQDRRRLGAATTRTGDVGRCAAGSRRPHAGRQARRLARTRIPANADDGLPCYLGRTACLMASVRSSFSFLLIRGFRVSCISNPEPRSRTTYVIVFPRSRRERTSCAGTSRTATSPRRSQFRTSSSPMPSPASTSSPRLRPARARRSPSGFRSSSAQPAPTAGPPRSSSSPPASSPRRWSRTSARWPPSRDCGSPPSTAARRSGRRPSGPRAHRFSSPPRAGCST